MATEFLPYDTSEYLDSPEAIEAYLREAFATGDAGLIQLAVGNVAKARGMSFVAERAGMSRTSLYRAFQQSSQPSFKTVLNVMRSLGYSLEPQQVEAWGDKTASQRAVTA